MSGFDAGPGRDVGDSLDGLHRFDRDDGAREAHVDASTARRAKTLVDHRRVASQGDGPAITRVDANAATGAKILVYINHVLSHLYANCIYI